MIYDFIVLACTAVIIISMIQTTRIGFLSKAIRAEINRVGDERMDIIKNGGSWEDVEKVKYPDIDQSHRNLKWYKLWERPSTLVVFEKE